MGTCADGEFCQIPTNKKGGFHGYPDAHMEFINF
jgi:hypothetical protein